MKWKVSLIDLESVYDISELYTIDKHNAKVKPDFYFKDLEKIWKEKMKPYSERWFMSPLQIKNQIESHLKGVIAEVTGVTPTAGVQ